MTAEANRNRIIKRRAAKAGICPNTLNEWIERGCFTLGTAKEDHRVLRIALFLHLEMGFSEAASTAHANKIRGANPRDVIVVAKETPAREFGIATIDACHAASGTYGAIVRSSELKEGLARVTQSSGIAVFDVCLRRANVTRRGSTSSAPQDA